MTSRIAPVQPDQHVVHAMISTLCSYKIHPLSHLIKELPWSQSIPDFTQETIATHTGTVTTKAILLFLLFPQEMVQEFRR